MNPIGKWACSVDSMLFRGEANVNIFEKDGAYDFELEISGIDIPEYTIKSVDVSDNHLKAVINIAMLGKDAIGAGAGIYFGNNGFGADYIYWQKQHLIMGRYTRRIQWRR